MSSVGNSTETNDQLDVEDQAYLWFIIAIGIGDLIIYHLFNKINVLNYLNES